ncbi:MAG TPA: hypothetical protein DHW34_05365 [Actinobacteria bacterium]|nr:hypothetical protein [Actinomycetota bacterium]
MSSLLAAPLDTGRSHRLPIVLVARAGVLVLCAALTPLTSAGASLRPLAELVVIAVIASVPWPASRITALIPVVEGVLAGAIIATASPLPQPLLPYLIVPALAAGLGIGFSGVMFAVVPAGTVILAAHWQEATAGGSAQLALIGQWAIVALAVGLIASWARRLLATTVDADIARYTSAFRLLDQLRQVSRQLSVGLDTTTLAESLLDEIADHLAADAIALLVVTDEQVVRPMGERGQPAIEAPVDLDDDSIWTRVHRSGEPEAFTASGDTTLAGIVLPLRTGDRTIGLLSVARLTYDFAPQEIEEALAICRSYAVRLEAALLFADIRFSATAEERRRLARDIHDGVAQELASLGYSIDSLIPSAQDDTSAAGLRELRAEVTRIITELRLSIFDLRSEVSMGTSLNVALSEYVHALGVGPDVEIHLVLQESPQRLGIDTEAELLRIAQEALTNARRHGKPRNIWVNSRIQPPAFELLAEDDGRGLQEGRADSYGLKIMRERAERIGGDLTVQARAAGGTTVRVARSSGAVNDNPAKLTP